MRLHLHQEYASAVEPTPHVLRVAAMFGLGLDQHRAMSIVPPCDIELHPGHILFITGPSGSGKSTILSLIRRHLEAQTATRWWDIADLPAPAEVPLVEAFPQLSLQATLRLLAQVGLSDAFVMLRRPSELSEGQRYRFRLARVLAPALHESPESENSWRKPPGPEVLPGAFPGAFPGAEVLPGVVLADEFGATLDRATAGVIAGNIRKLATRTGLTFVLATTHDDLLEALDPDVLMVKGFGSALQVVLKTDIRNPK